MYLESICLGKGNGLFIGSGLSSEKQYDNLLNIVNVGISAGICSFDTAPSYKTEVVLGNAIRACLKLGNVTREDLYIQTKVDAWQMQEKNGDVYEYVIDSLDKMQLQYFDSVLVHWPIPEYLENTMINLRMMKECGIIRNIGVCNVRKRHIKQMIDNHLLPDIIQIERNPLRTSNDEIEICKENDIIVQAYSPLCKMNSKLKNNILLQAMSQKYGKSIGQIILRWHIDTGVIPIFTSTKVDRIQEYSNIFDFSLSIEDILKISSLNENYKLYLESWLCPGF